jgi:hypothetical protein
MRTRYAVLRSSFRRRFLSTTFLEIMVDSGSSLLLQMSGVESLISMGNSDLLSLVEDMDMIAHSLL